MQTEADMNALPSQTAEESDKQYQIRLIRMKLRGQIDMDWSELAGWLRMGCSGEHLRRIAYGVRLVDEAMEGLERGAETGDPLCGKFASGLQEMRDLRNEAVQAYRLSDRDRAIREQIGRSIRNLPPIHIAPKSRPAGGHGTLVVPLADVHYGKSCVIKDLDGKVLNKYDTDVFEQRMDRILSFILNDLNKTHADRLVIPLLGDSIDGMLRVSQLMQLRYGIVDSCIRYAEYMAQWLSALTELSGVPVTVINLCGNHDEIRPLNSKRGDFGKENMGRIVGWYLQARFLGINGIEIVAASDKSVYDVEGFRFLFIHGDGESREAKAAKDYGFLYGQNIDYVVRGHLHTYALDTVGVSNSGTPIEEIFCPSICGVDDYSISLKRSSPPGIISFIIKPGEGKTETYQHYFNNADGIGGEQFG